MDSRDSRARQEASGPQGPGLPEKVPRGPGSGAQPRRRRPARRQGRGGPGRPLGPRKRAGAGAGASLESTRTKIILKGGAGGNVTQTKIGGGRLSESFKLTQTLSGPFKLRSQDDNYIFCWHQIAADSINLVSKHAIIHDGLQTTKRHPENIRNQTRAACIIDDSPMLRPSLIMQWIRPAN